MEKFINENFLLENKYARELYSGYAADAPIIDFHCHINPKEILDDIKWKNIWQLWKFDSYKWRAMRSDGVEERFCTGDAPDREKFEKFSEAMPRLMRNPLYHWTHMELARYFGIDDLLLSKKTSEEVWERTSEILNGGLSAREFLRNSKVKVVCTTDDPVSDLSVHDSLAKSGFEISVLPTFRPDKAFQIEKGNVYVEYLNQLEQAAGMEIRSYDDLLNAIKRRHDFFHEMGCRTSDYGVEKVWFRKNPYYEIETTFKKAILGGEQLAPEEIESFKTALLLECAAMDYDRGWVRQIHIGTIRNANTKMFELVGPETGFDSMGESNYAKALAEHLDRLNSAGKLGKTILYNINPKDTEMLATMLGNFQDSQIPCKMQLGSGWWFMNQIDGISKQIEATSKFSILGRFVGILTDSRSFTSYIRHDYFRRVFCNILGKDMELGRLPKDMESVGKIVSDVSYQNAKEYFGF